MTHLLASIYKIFFFFQPGDCVGHGHCGLVTYIHIQFIVTDITGRITVKHCLGLYVSGNILSKI